MSAAQRCYAAAAVAFGDRSDRTQQNRIEGNVMAIPTAAELAARPDRLPMTRHIWVLVTLISLGGGFELYDLFLTAYIAPGLLKAGYFTSESLGPFSILTPYGIAGIGTFVFALFAGLFVGAIFLGHFADRYGRRTVFTFH